MSTPDDCPKVQHPISMSSRVTLATVVVVIPFVAYAASIGTRVKTLEEARAEERAEIRAELKEVKNKLDAILLRIPLVRP